MELFEPIGLLSENKNKSCYGSLLTVYEDFSIIDYWTKSKKLIIGNYNIVYLRSPSWQYPINFR